MLAFLLVDRDETQKCGRCGFITGTAHLRIAACKEGSVVLYMQVSTKQISATLIGSRLEGDCSGGRLGGESHFISPPQKKHPLQTATNAVFFRTLWSRLA